MLIFLGTGLHYLQSTSKKQGRISPIDVAVRTLNSPIATASRVTAQKTQGFLAGAFSGDRLATENARLKRQLEAMSIYNETVTLLRHEVDQLRLLQQLPATYQRPKVIADITSYTPSEHLIKVAAGSSAGVKEGMPVVSAEGLVGKVQAVSSGESQVMLITSVAFKIGAIAPAHTPPPAGIIAGENGPTLLLSFQTTSAPVVSGDEITTSGFSTFIPRGIRIGRVLSVDNLPEIGASRARILPSASVGSLREVVILK